MNQDRKLAIYVRWHLGPASFTGSSPSNGKLKRSRLRRCAGIKLADLNLILGACPGGQDQDNRRNHINNIRNCFLKF